MTSRNRCNIKSSVRPGAGAHQVRSEPVLKCFTSVRNGIQPVTGDFKSESQVRNNSLRLVDTPNSRETSKFKRRRSFRTRNGVNCHGSTDQLAT